MYAAAAHRGATTALAGPLLVALRASTLGGMARALGRAATAAAQAHDELHSSFCSGHGRALATIGGAGIGAGTSLPAGADLFLMLHTTLRKELTKLMGLLHAAKIKADAERKPEKKAKTKATAKSKAKNAAAAAAAAAAMDQAVLSTATAASEVQNQCRTIIRGLFALVQLETLVIEADAKMSMSVMRALCSAGQANNDRSNGNRMHGSGRACRVAKAPAAVS